MSILRTLLNRTARGPLTSRFDRYYGEVARAGVGYPTADEARRDMARTDRGAAPYGWMR